MFFYLGLWFWTGTCSTWAGNSNFCERGFRTHLAPGRDTNQMFSSCQREVDTVGQRWPCRCKAPGHISQHRLCSNRIQGLKGDRGQRKFRVPTRRQMKEWKEPKQAHVTSCVTIPKVSLCSCKIIILSPTSAFCEAFSRGAHTSPFHVYQVESSDRCRFLEKDRDTHERRDLRTSSHFNLLTKRQIPRRNCSIPEAALGNSPWLIWNINTKPCFVATALCSGRRFPFGNNPRKADWYKAAGGEARLLREA